MINLYIASILFAVLTGWWESWRDVVFHNPKTVWGIKKHPYFYNLFMRLPFYSGLCLGLFYQTGLENFALNVFILISPFMFFHDRQYYNIRNIKKPGDYAKRDGMFVNTKTKTAWTDKLYISSWPVRLIIFLTGIILNLIYY